MTEEQKELLLKDLCVRLPYGVILKTDNVFPQKLEGISFDKNTFLVWVSDGGFTLDCMDCKPYLFPLSSMTEDQEKELYKVYSDEASLITEYLKSDIFGDIHNHRFNHHLSLDWYLKNHFDINGLIEKGLAIDATDKNIY